VAKQNKNRTGPQAKFPGNENTPIKKNANAFEGDGSIQVLNSRRL
jgi:hypothetical protein